MNYKQLSISFGKYILTDIAKKKYWNHEGNEINTESLFEVFLDKKQIKNRSLKFHRLFFGALEIVYSSLPENWSKIFPTQELFRKSMTRASGYTEKVYIGKNKYSIETMSISFEKMDEIQFRNFSRKFWLTVYNYYLCNCDLIDIFGDSHNSKIVEYIYSSIENEN